MTDAELVEASRGGDVAAFGALVARYQRMVEGVAFACAGRRGGHIDDVVQETFITAWRTLDQLRDPAHVRSWLGGIARNGAYKAHRKQARSQPAVEAVDAATPFDALCDAEERHRVTTTLARLPRRYREPLVLFYYEQCTVKEVAAALGLREDAVMQRLSRGRRQLGEALATNVEVALERKPSRAALAACVVALLPARVASAMASAVAPAASALSTAGTTAAPLASAMSAASTTAAPVASAISAASLTACARPTSPMPRTTTAASVAKVASIALAAFRAAIGGLVARWRLVGAVVASAAALLIVLVATERSRAVAANHRSATADVAAEVAAPTPPALPASDDDDREGNDDRDNRRDDDRDREDDREDDGRIYRSIGLASSDPEEACGRAARSLVTITFGEDPFRRVGENVYWEPSPELEEARERVASKVASTCEGGPWPEIYVVCEGTQTEIRDGNVACYPFDPFDPIAG